MKQVKILKINQANLNDKNEVINLTDDNFVKVGTYNFLFRTLETYRDKKYEDGEYVTEIIKVMLSKYEKTAREQWFNGVTWEGKLYKAWFATTGGIKQEKKTSKSKCEVIFVSEEIADYKSYFEDIISLGKFAMIDKTKDMYVNKKILSRFSLATSDIITEIDMPDIIILPQAHLHINKTYKTVKPKDAIYTTPTGKEKPCKDYDLVDYVKDDDIDIFDGGGIATPKVMNAIGKTLNRNDIDFAIIRAYGNGIKGMVTRFNIIGYLDVIYPKVGDTEYCRKIDGHYELLDMYGDWQIVTDNTLLLNESMVKLADMFENTKEYKDLLEKYNTEEFKDIYNLLSKLYITKANKKNEELKQYRRMNYQIMNNLALTTDEYNTLAEQDFKLFKKILKPFEKGTSEKEFITNVDYINLFYNQCCGEEEEIEDLKEITNCVDKSNVLININQENVKLSYVKKNLAKLIEKKTRDMAQGKITLKATYNYIAVDPISYLNYYMTRELGDNGLNKDEFYCRAINDGETRTIFRNPLMAYSEVHNVKFKRNNFLDNWLCQSAEIVYFNDKSDILSLMGSADKDGDSCTIIDNEIVKNAVIEPQDGKYFCFTADGEKKECKFDGEGRFLATYTPSGNLIGEVAIMGASVNNNNQNIELFYNRKSDKFYTWNDVTNKLIKNNKVDIEEKTDDEKYKMLDDFIKTNLIDKGILEYSNNVENDILKERIKQNFYDNEKEIYSLLYVSSLVIDSPKTMNCIDVPSYTKLIRKKYPRKAHFLQYAKKLQDVKKEDYDYSINSALDNFADRVQEELLNVVADRKKDFSDKGKELQKQLINNKYTKENAEKAWDDISSLYDSYKSEITKAETTKRQEDGVVNKKMAEHRAIYSDVVTDKWSDLSWQKDLETIKNEFSVNAKNYKNALNKIDRDFLQKANEIVAENDIYSVAIALSKLDKVTERFIINFFMSALIAVDKINPSIKYEYIKCNEDEIDSITYLYNTYKKIEKKVNLSNAVIEKLATKDLVRYKLAAEVRFKNEDMQLVQDIKNGLAVNGYYDLDITNMEAFDEFQRILKDKTVVRIKDFMLKKDGTEAIAKKSFGVCIEM